MVNEQFMKCVKFVMPVSIILHELTVGNGKTAFTSKNTRTIKYN